MSKLLFRRAAFAARARLAWLAAPLACAWVAGASVARAAEVAPGQAVSVPIMQYQRWRDEPLQDWRQANERVGEIGGWRTYLRESQPSGDGPDSGQDQPGRHGH
jgi:hypothetical protein